MTTATNSKNTLVLLNKPAGITSFDCIRQLKRILNRKDLGHGGTLDKFATGVLPVFLGEGLKISRFFLESYPNLPTYWKTYTGTIQFGISTDTGCPEGAVTRTSDTLLPPKDSIEIHMQEFTGREYLQMPPDYSAKKIDGKRASDRVRDGENIELKPSSVKIKTFRLLSCDPDKRSVRFETCCSKGTYVRVLVQDLATKFGNVAHLTQLERSAVGDYTLGECQTIDEISATGAREITITDATRFLPEFTLRSGDLENIRTGRNTDLIVRLSNSGLGPNAYCARTPDGQSVALLEIDAHHQAHFLRAFVL